MSRVYLDEVVSVEWDKEKERYVIITSFGEGDYASAFYIKASLFENRAEFPKMLKHWLNVIIKQAKEGNEAPS